VVQSIGIDLVDINRIEKSVKRYGQRFVRRILGSKEIGIYDSRNDKAAYLAGRFAAKEAVIKSLGRILATRPKYSAIEILNDKTGNPFLSGTGELTRVFKKRKCLLSISHEHRYATAVAIITED